MTAPDGVPAPAKRENHARSVFFHEQDGKVTTAAPVQLDRLPWSRWH